MKSMQMKALAVAVLGLAGFGMAGSAMAACDNTNLAAWSAQATNQGSLTVAAGGLESTPSACKLGVSLTGTDPLSSAAVVFSDPTTEPTYHFRFYFNQDNLGALAGLGASAQIFALRAATTNYPSTKPNSFIFRLGITSDGTGTNKLVAAVACDNGGNHICLTTPLAISSGNHYVEGAMTTGASGTFKLWLDKNTTLPSQPAPDASLTINNAGWSGGKAAALGLGAHQPGFTLGQNVFFDAFDSRRQTFIGP